MRAVTFARLVWTRKCWQDSRFTVRGMSPIRETSHDCEQQHDGQGHTRTVRSRIGYGRWGCISKRQRIESNTSSSGVVFARGILGYGREDETEILPADSDSGIVIHHLTQLYGLIQQRARRARVTETYGSTAELMQRPGFGRSIADRPGSGEAAFEGDGPGAPSRTDDQRPSRSRPKLRTSPERRASAACCCTRKSASDSCSRMS